MHCVHFYLIYCLPNQRSDCIYSRCVKQKIWKAENFLFDTFGLNQKGHFLKEASDPRTLYLPKIGPVKWNLWKAAFLLGLFLNTLSHINQRLKKTSTTVLH